MNTLFKSTIPLVCVVSFLASPLHSLAASHVEAQGAAYGVNCGYWSGTNGMVRITYSNDSLPWGTIVEVRHGLEGFAPQDDAHPIDWQVKDNAVMTPQSPYTWSTDILFPIQMRGGMIGELYTVTALNFVFRIVLPDDRIVYDRGSLAPLSFYRTELPEAQSCTLEVDQLEVLAVERIERG